MLLLLTSLITATYVQGYPRGKWSTHAHYCGEGNFFSLVLLSTAMNSTLCCYQPLLEHTHTLPWVGKFFLCVVISYCLSLQRKTHSAVIISLATRISQRGVEHTLSVMGGKIPALCCCCMSYYPCHSHGSEHTGCIAILVTTLFTLSTFFACHPRQDV